MAEGSELEERKKKVAEGFSSVFGGNGSSSSNASDSTPARQEHHHPEHTPVHHSTQPAHSQSHDHSAQKKDIFEIRKEKISGSFAKAGGFLKRGPELFYYAALLVIIWIGVWIRTRNLSMIQAGALPADPDSALFLRYAQTIAEQGSLPVMDWMRYVPIGFNTLQESRLLAYFIAGMYKVIHIFNPVISVLTVDMLYPVIIFPFIIIAFFFLVKKIFDWRVALVASAFLAVIPAFLQRTMLGFSDKEPLGTLFFFGALYFLVSGFRESNSKWRIAYGVLSGVATGLVGLTWGAVSFLFMIIGFTFLALLLFNQLGKKEFMFYLVLVLAMVPTLFISARYSLLGFVTDPSSGIVFLPLPMFLLFFLFNSKLKDKRILRLPHNVSGIVLGFLLAVLVFGFYKGFGQLFSFINATKEQLLHPFGTLRLTLTVAENQQPYTVQWIGNFGLFFWLMIAGAILLAYMLFAHFGKRYKIALMITSAIFILTLIFTRYTPESIFNGTNLISQVFFFGGMALFGLLLLYLTTIASRKEKEEMKNFESIDIVFFLTLIWFAWAVIGARGAVRLIYFLAPIASVLGALFIVKVGENAGRFKDNLLKIAIVLLIAILALFMFSAFFKASAAQTKGSYPNLHPQWMGAMDWVKGNTVQDAVFAHWWDYGYWVQTGGERATVLDGGNAIPYWDHLMGRYVLTSPSDKEALEFLYTHNSTHLLIDSSDIGKYPAYSLIGSDANFDRFSSIPPFGLNEEATQETRDGVVYLFQGGAAFDDDFSWKGEFFPKQTSGIGGFLVPVKNGENGGTIFEKPTAIAVNNGNRVDIPLKCLFVDERKIEFQGEGIDGCLYVISRLSQDGKLKSIGSAFYLSPKTKNSLMARLYLLEEKNPSFKLVHTEEDILVADIRAKTGLKIPSIIDFNGVRAPIKIWEISYPKGTKINSTFLKTDFPSEELSRSQGSSY